MMNSNNYWSSAEVIEPKPLLEPAGSIDPTFSQGQHGGPVDDGSYSSGTVAAAVANAQRQAKQQEAAAAVAAVAAAAASVQQSNQLQQHVSPQPVSPQDHDDTQVIHHPDSLEINRQGRPLTNTKRAQQNRQAQRAFRQRKEMYIKDLEAKVHELKASKDTIDALRQENIQLRDYILALQSRLIEHPGGVPTPPAVYARQQADLYEQPKGEK